MDPLRLDEVKARLDTSSWKETPFMDKDSLAGRAYDLSGFEVLHWFSSSGTTAEPVIYPWTADDETVAERTVRKIHKIRDHSARGLGMIIAPLGLSAMWFHMNRQLRSLGLTTLLPGLSPPAGLIHLIDKLQPSLFMSLPLVLARLGEYWRANHCSGTAKSGVTRLYCGGDCLSHSRRKRLERLWGAEVSTFYGLSEVFGPLAGESSEPGSLVWEADDVFVEILDPETKVPVERDETGVAVLTTLNNRPAALVRYWTGDYFRLREWLGPGRPRFEMRGRESVALRCLRPGAFLQDVDELLLSDPAAGMEWKVQQLGSEISLTVESPHDAGTWRRETVEGLQTLFRSPVQMRTVPSRSLDVKGAKLEHLFDGSLGEGTTP